MLNHFVGGNLKHMHKLYIVKFNTVVQLAILWRRLIACTKHQMTTTPNFGIILKPFAPYNFLKLFVMIACIVLFYLLVGRVVQQQYLFFIIKKNPFIPLSFCFVNLLS